MMAAGSSPRGRGKPQELPNLLDDLGLIPAWAGKTGAGGRGCPPSRAHPRVGGENGPCGEQTRSTLGSSPRGRGKRGLSVPRSPGEGLIPAWAGKTTRRHARAPHLRAHPRVGGENISSPITGRAIRGSSPRGRGKRGARPRTRRLSGLIPAWAGKTAPTIMRPIASPAHPRVGGENTF